MFILYQTLENVDIKNRNSNDFPSSVALNSRCFSVISWPCESLKWQSCCIAFEDAVSARRNKQYDTNSETKLPDCIMSKSFTIYWDASISINDVMWTLADDRVMQGWMKSRGIDWVWLNFTELEKHDKKSQRKNLTENREEIIRDRRETRESRANSWSKVKAPVASVFNNVLLKATLIFDSTLCTELWAAKAFSLKSWDCINQ